MADPANAPGSGRGGDLGEDASGMVGHDAGEVGTAVDHVLKPAHAQVEGMPEPEEDPREEPEDHGHVSVEHIMQASGNPPLIPHETMEPQLGPEDAD
ncbi:hypothetical protein ABPG75_000275 [Micractinium tetrahymenae]